VLDGMDVGVGVSNAGVEIVDCGRRSKAYVSREWAVDVL